MTPFSPLQAAGMALVIVLMGFFGGLVMSAIKRDRGVKDWGHLIAGHGGFIDRLDSVIFSAPDLLPPDPLFLVRDMTGDRRPLASRDTGWAKATARWLTATRVTPNQISFGSMVAGLLLGRFILGRWRMRTVRFASVFLILGAAFCQARLICNLLDGMVAVEGGKSGPDGPFWNEFPDRVADILIFAGIGLGLGQPGLGFAAAAMAVLTAYTRELGGKNGAPADFCGPMAKQHRMATVTVAAVIAVVRTDLGLAWHHA